MSHKKKCNLVIFTDTRYIAMYQTSQDTSIKYSVTDYTIFIYIFFIIIQSF